MSDNRDTDGLFMILPCAFYAFGSFAVALWVASYIFWLGALFEVAFFSFFICWLTRIFGGYWPWEKS